MAIEIAARYENVDQAEFALVRLGELGIHPQSYRIRSTNLLGGETNDTPYPSTGILLDGAHAGVSTSVPLYSFINAVPSSNLSSGNETPEEVSVHMLVDDNDAARTQSALISTHGYQIKQY